MTPPRDFPHSILSGSILVPKLHILTISKIRKLDIPRMLHNRSIPLLVLPAIVHQKRNRGRNRNRIHNNNRELSRKVDGRVFVAESQRAEDVSLLCRKKNQRSFIHVCLSIKIQFANAAFLKSCSFELTRQKLMSKMAFMVTFFVCPP